MRNTQKMVQTFLIALLSALLSVSAFAQGAGTANPSRQTLSATPDGKYLVDATGKKKLQYLDSAKAFVPTMADDQPDGKLSLNKDTLSKGLSFYPCNCRNECIRWDANGKCLQTYRTCDICVKGDSD